jgi:hypothetical protein
MEVCRMTIQKLLGVTATLAIALVLFGGCEREPWWTDPDVTWIKTYGGDGSDVGEDIMLAQDGGYFIVGTSNLRFNPVPQGDVYLVRTDSSGRLLWEKTFEEEGLQKGESITRSSDGTLLIAGCSSSSGNESIDAYLLSVNQDGSALWSKTVGGPLDERVLAAYEVADGGHLLAGNIVDPADVVADPGAAGYGGYDGRSSIYLARIDAVGNEVWSRSHDLGVNVLASSAVRMPDDGLLILATITYFPDPDDDLYLLRVDESGNEIWAHTWKAGRSGGRDLIPTSDGNYLIAGRYSRGDDADRSKADFLFIKIDPMGNEIWARTFGDPGTIDYGEVIVESAGGGFVAAGDRTTSYYARSEDLLLVKIDANGEFLWERIFETAVHNMHGGIVRHPDGGYAVVGSTIMENDTFDVFLVKTDSEGNAEN